MSTTDDKADSGRGLHHPLTWLELIASNLRRLVIFLFGITVLGAGLAMLVLPGPGLIVAILGLAILATEFAWAERTLDRAKERTKKVTDQIDDSRSARGLLLLSAVALVGGGLVAALFSESDGLGLSAIVAGTCAMAVLVPRVRRWILT
ncbi:MAG: PGPGW domain-containing protein [Acidimicrobiales bacterium]